MLSIRQFGVIGRAYRDLKRYREIIGVLFKYGFSDVVRLLHLERYVEMGMHLISKHPKSDVGRRPAEVRLRLALEELGPTFVKLGQILSTRPDLIPESFAEELTKLQDHVPSFPYDQVVEIFQEEFGASPEDIYASFSKEPLAAASIGQVHEATLPSGESVVVKVQRPGIQRIIEVDLEILFHLATLAENHVEEVNIQRPSEIVTEFAEDLNEEIDYDVEAMHAERFAAQFAGDETQHVPTIYRKFSSKRILTMERINGVKSSNVEKLREDGFDLKEIAKRGVDSLMRQFFVFGYFHGDPHPGNIQVLPGNVICFLDFGMMGSLTGEERSEFADLLSRIMERDEAGIAKRMLKLCEYDRRPDRHDFERHLSELVNNHLFRPLEQLEMGVFLDELLKLLARLGLRLRPNLFLMIKAFISLEKLGRSLDPKIDIIAKAAPFVKTLKMSPYRPRAVMDTAVEVAGELVELLREGPEDIRSLLRIMRDGDWRIQFNHHGLKSLERTIGRSIKYLVFAVVLAALIVGHALVTLSKIGPKIFDMPILGVGGFVIACIIGFWLLVSILFDRN